MPKRTSQAPSKIPENNHGKSTLTLQLEKANALKNMKMQEID